MIGRERDLSSPPELPFRDPDLREQPLGGAFNEAVQSVTILFHLASRGHP